MLLFAAALLTANLGDFTLESGKILRDLKICYRTYGTPNADNSNIILFPTWFNGTTEGQETYITGKDAFVDPSRYYVISIDAIGNGVSTSPTNSATQKNNAFPRITIADMVRTQHLLLTKVLKINRVHGLIGISMGGMQVFEWTARYPSFADRAVSVVGTPQMGATDMMLWMKFIEQAQEMGRGGGNDTSNGSSSKSGGWQGRILDGLGAVLGARGNGNGGGRSFPMPLNALRQFDAIAAHDATKHFGGSLEETAQKMPAKFLMVIADKDEVVSGRVPTEFAKLTNSTIVTLEGAGHNGYKTAREKISRASLPFFEQKTPAPLPSIFQRVKTAAPPVDRRTAYLRRSDGQSMRNARAVGSFVR
jgi:homoserine O-acetyltransferase/O-succinyltransferase